MKITGSLLRFLLVVFAASAFSPYSVRAQLQVGATYGVLIPTFSPLVREFGGLNGSPVPYPVLEKWHVGAPALTGRAIWRASARFDFEVAMIYSRGQIATRDSLNHVADLGAQLLIGSVRLPILISSRAAAIVTHVTPGIGYSVRTGPAWRGFEGRNRPGGILGIGVRTRVKPRSRYWFHLGVEDNFQWSRFRQGGAKLAPQFNHFMVISVGLVYQFPR